MPELSNWDVSSKAVWHEQVGNQTISLRHPTYPAEADCDDVDQLKEFVADYLAEVAEALGLPPLFRDRDPSEFKVHLAWLPYDPEDKDFLAIWCDSAGSVGKWTIGKLDSLPRAAEPAGLYRNRPDVHGAIMCFCKH